MVVRDGVWTANWRLNSDTKRKASEEAASPLSQQQSKKARTASIDGAEKVCE